MTGAGARARALLAGCACAVLAYTAASPSPASPLLALLLGCIGILLTTGLFGLVVPRWLVAAVTIGILLRTFSRALSDGLDIYDFAEFVTWMMVVKIFDRRSAADDAQLLALSIFLCVAAMLISNGLTVAVLTFVYLPCIAYAAMHLQLRLCLEKAQRLADRGPRGTPVAPRIRSAAGVSAAAHLRTASVVGLVLGFAVAAFVFVILPRGAGLHQIGRWGGPGAGRIVGFADRLRIGMGGVISTSRTPVLHLKMTDSSDRPFGGLGAIRYLRGAVLDRYEDGTWTSSNPPSLGGDHTDVTAGEAISLAGTGGESMIYEHITLLNTPREDSYLFTVWRPTEVRFHDPTAYTLCREDGTIMVSGGGGRLRYSVRSSVFEHAYHRRAEREPVSWPSPVVAEVAAGVLSAAGIDPDPRTRSLADDSIAINALRRHFWSNYTYTLDVPPAPPDVDPIDWFVTRGSRGHCEYYAAALAAMCRSVGIRARVVTGYVAAEYNAATGAYIIRASNAHAWVEAQQEPGVWKTYDATPPADLLEFHGPEPGLLARAGRALDAINYAWVNSVVAFDSQARSDLLSWSDPFTSAVSRRVSRAFDAAGSARPRVLVPALLGVAFPVVSAALGAVALLAAIRQIRRRLAARPSALARRIADPNIRGRIRATPLYQEMLTTLARAGIRKPGWQPPLSWGDSLHARSPALGDAVRSLAELFYIMRFGGRDLTPRERAEARRLLDALATHAAQSAGAGAPA